MGRCNVVLLHYLSILLCAGSADVDLQNESVQALKILQEVVEDLVLITDIQNTANGGYALRGTFKRFCEDFVYLEILQSIFHVSEVLRVRTVAPGEQYTPWLEAEIADLQARLRQVGITTSGEDDGLPTILREADVSSAAARFAEAYAWITVELNLVSSSNISRIRRYVRTGRIPRGQAEQLSETIKRDHRTEPPRQFDVQYSAAFLDFLD